MADGTETLSSRTGVRCSSAAYGPDSMWSAPANQAPLRMVDADLGVRKDARMHAVPRWNPTL
jgi:hypothetical protein